MRLWSNLLLAALLGCHGGNAHPPASDGGREGISAAAAGGEQASPTGGSSVAATVEWQPAQGERQPSDGPDCGPGCRMVLSRPVEHDSWQGHAFSENIVADTNPHQLLF